MFWKFFNSIIFLSLNIILLRIQLYMNNMKIILQNNITTTMIFEN